MVSISTLMKISPTCRLLNLFDSASNDNIRLWNAAEAGEADAKSKSGVQFKIIPGHHGGYISQMGEAFFFLAGGARSRAKLLLGLKLSIRQQDLWSALAVTADGTVILREPYLCTTSSRSSDVYCDALSIIGIYFLTDCETEEF